MQLSIQQICHWLVRGNSCVIFEAGVLFPFGAISCDSLLDQSGLKIGCEIMFQNSSCANFIKVLCSINSLLQLKYLLMSLN